MKRSGVGCVATSGFGCLHCSQLASVTGWGMSTGVGVWEEWE